MTLRTIASVALVLALVMSAPALGDDASAEIEHLLTTMGQSNCTFIRNGKEYDSADAEAHLRMKYRRAKRYASTAEDFIDNLASQSSMSRKPYRVACNNEEPRDSGPWLRQILIEYRDTTPADDESATDRGSDGSGKLN